MAGSIVDTAFLNIPFLASLGLSTLLLYWFYKDRNKRKLMFAIGIFIGAFGYQRVMAQNIGGALLFASPEWLFVPISLAVPIASLSSYFKKKNFDRAFKVFLAGTAIALLLFFTQISVEAVRVPIMISFMALSIPTLMYLYIKNKDASTLAFFIATLCFMFQGIALDADLAVEIPVLLSLFGMIFTGLMFAVPDSANLSSIGSSLRLEKQLDITNEELKRTQEKLLKTERLAAIGELAGMIGHDLRNPLQGITGATYYLKARTSPKLNETEREMIETIETCIQRSNKIINDLLEYSREIYLDYEVTTPKVLLSDTLRQLELPKRINLINETQNEPKLRIDKGKIERVFVNIIRNAFEAMPETGTLAINSETKDDNVVFTFKDTGIGITEEALSKLWTPLYTTKATGMGFGLAICKRIIEAHSGEIHVESEPGKGSTFTVTFPQMPKPAIYGQNIYLSTPEIAQKTNAIIAATK